MTTGGVFGAAGSIADEQVGSRGSRRAGATGELHTAAALRELQRYECAGLAVFHALDVPVPGVRADIDHIVVSGSRITIFDSKTWRSGWYWTFGGVTRRGIQRLEHPDRSYMPRAAKAIERYLERAGLAAGTFEVTAPVLVVWPPSTAHRAPRLLGYRAPDGLRVLAGHRLGAKAKRLLGGFADADARIVLELQRLVRRSGGHT